MFSVQAATIKAVQCGSKFVRVSDDKFMLLERCGAPKSSEKISGDSEELVERMYYTLPNTAPMVFTVKQGKIVKYGRV
ncbi:DUF2845 domain-containing protein [Thalassotalea sp. Y01]|uniref:DUF2845 domain-containing protein n=1 Tax=Thalassotalea sp. Y01 TaxID=2729613 RepID=UPI00145D8B76|nr:DUF2845 domain-containing protein [Thalassotalea sp. Y01]NMP17308.1 DUF2845 domain-containing protein [Thalassotalea sp. Y01]